MFFSETGFDVESDIHECVHDYVCMMESLQTHSNDHDQTVWIPKLIYALQMLEGFFFLSF